MSPHLFENSRNGHKMGAITLVDSMIKDGLWDPYNNFHMGSAAELCAKEFSFSREEQDAFAKRSYEKAQHAQTQGLFKTEIYPVEIAEKKGASKGKVDSPAKFDQDEEPAKARFDKMKELRPAFEKDGTITAANASKLNDGAAALVLSSAAGLARTSAKPVAKVLGYASFAQDPKWFTTAPKGAVMKALDRAELSLAKIDLFEINEAFSVVPMALIKEMKIDEARVNVNGGAIALGHPIGASGARLLTTLIHSLQQRSLRYGMVTLCVGGGEGVALVVERL